MKPFLLGKKTLTIDALRAPPGFVPTHSPAGAPEPAHHHPTEALGSSVEVVKQGDKVVRLLIKCTCGERIEIDCLYPAGS